MKRLLFIFAFVLLSSAVLLGTQTQLDTDNFSGTAGTDLPTYNANWVNSTLINQWFPPYISTPNGGAVGNGGFSSAAYRTGQTWTNDQYAQATLAVLPISGNAKICVRMLGDVGTSNPTSGYCVGPEPNFSGQNYRLYDVMVGQLAVSATSAVANDVVNIEMVGTTITVRVNGSIISDLTTTDASHATGNPGIFLGDASAKWTTWSAGSAGSAATGKPSSLMLTGVSN